MVVFMPFNTLSFKSLDVIFYIFQENLFWSILTKMLIS